MVSKLCLANVCQVEILIIFELFNRSNVQTMATINFRIRSNANKNVSIYITLSQGRGNVLELNTRFSIHPKDWGTGKPKQNNSTGNKQLTNSLKKLDTYISDNLNSDLSKGVLIDSYWLESQINTCFNRIEKVDAGLIINHVQFIIDNANTRKIKGRSKLGISQSAFSQSLKRGNADAIISTDQYFRKIIAGIL